MKKVLLDVNILNKKSIRELNESKIIRKINRSIKFYVSEIVLKQNLIKLYYSNNTNDYDFYVNFMKTWCNSGIIDAAEVIVRNEIMNNFSPVKTISSFKTKDLLLRRDAKKQLDRFRNQLDNLIYKTFTSNSSFNVTSFFNLKYIL